MPTIREPQTRYRLVNRDLLLYSGEKPYEFRIRDLPAHEKPREKLIANGPGSLSVSELLSVVLNTGTRKEGVREMSARIVKEYGEKSILTRMDAKTMASDLDIPLGKATQIIACGELGRRFFRNRENGAPIIRTARDVYNYVGDMLSLPKEHLRGIYLNNHYQVIHDEVISIGTVDSNIVHPREVFRPAITYAAAAVVLVHNHPSGVTDPSEADILITQQIARAGEIVGIDLIDHVIVTTNGFASILSS